MFNSLTEPNHLVLSVRGSAGHSERTGADRTSMVTSASNANQYGTLSFPSCYSVLLSEL